VFAANTQINDIDTLISRTMQRQNVPGVSVAVLNEGEVTFHSQGYVCLENSIKIKEDTFFYIASLTKAFTALGIQWLDFEKKLSIDDPVSFHIPWINFSYRASDFSVDELTIRHLLNHTSGLGDFTHSATIPFQYRSDALYQSVQAINSTRLRRRPGVGFEYASINYILLGFLIQEVYSKTYEEKSYEEFMLSRILHPLGLYNTKMSRQAALDSGVLVQGYRPSWFRSRPYSVYVNNSHTPTGFMISNAMDLSKWLEFHINPQNAPKPFDILIPKSHVPDTTVPAVEIDTGFYYYGFGWHISQNDDFDRVRHAGFLSNFVSEALFYQEEELGVIVLMNSSSGYAGNLADNIIAITRGEEAGHIAFGFMMKNMDTIFSAISLFSIGVVLGLLVIFVLEVIKNKKNKIIYKNPSIRGRIFIGFIVTSIVLLTLIPAVFPFALNITWATAVMWIPHSAYTLYVFSTLVFLSVGLIILLRILYPRKNKKK